MLASRPPITSWSRIDDGPITLSSAGHWWNTCHTHTHTHTTSPWIWHVILTPKSDGIQHYRLNCGADRKLIVGPIVSLSQGSLGRWMRSGPVSCMVPVAEKPDQSKAGKFHEWAAICATLIRELELYVKRGAALMGIPGSLDTDRVARSTVKRCLRCVVDGLYTIYFISLE